MPRTPTRSRPAGPTASAAPAAYAFVVRLWQEARTGARSGAVWRGTVSDLQGQALGSFSTAAELASLVGRRAEAEVLLHLSFGPPPAAR